MPDSRLDPVTIEVLWNRLISVADEQAKALYRGSFSTIVSEVEDYCSTLHDASGRMIAQSVSSGTISMLTGQTKSIKVLVERFAGNVQPGDAIICNDPWLLAGHKWDVTLASPFFRGDTLIGWAVTSLHAADIGGLGFTAASRDTYEEGLTFPPLKLFKAGAPNEDLFDLIRANVRMPDQVIGDFLAQAAANKIGATMVLALLEEYGLPDLEGISEEIITRSERAIRQAIDQLPDGVYSHTVLLDGFDEPLEIACRLTIEGSEVSADFEGTSPQVQGAINAVGYVAYGRVAHAVKSALAPRIPNNEGLFRPISVSAPTGCLVNARYPAATAARHVLHFFISAAAFGALAQIVPTPPGVIADSGAGVIHSLRGQDAMGNPYEYWFMFSHGMGATPLHDGYSGTCAPNNVASTPIEIIEARTPVFFLKKELIPDSGGPGRHRGGHAQEYQFRVRSASPTVLSCMFDRTKHPPLGYLGGMDGGLAQVRVGGRDVHPKGQYTLSSEDVVTVRGPGGGGFFAPSERDPEVVLKDVLAGLVSVEQTREVYRVGLSADLASVDVDETRRLRQAMTTGAATGPAPRSG